MKMRNAFNLQNVRQLWPLNEVIALCVVCVCVCVCVCARAHLF